MRYSQLNDLYLSKSLTERLNLLAYKYWLKSAGLLTTLNRAENNVHKTGAAKLWVLIMLADSISTDRSVQHNDSESREGWGYETYFNRWAQNCFLSSWSFLELLKYFSFVACRVSYTTLVSSLLATPAVDADVLSLGNVGWDMRMSMVFANVDNFLRTSMAFADLCGRR